jgi:putative membrane protein
MNASRRMTLAAAIAAASIAAAPALAQPYGPGMMGGYGYGYGPIHLVVWAVVLIAIVAGVVWLVRTRSGAAAGNAARRSAGLDVLEERYARGEINRDEYLEKKKDLLG